MSDYANKMCHDTSGIDETQDDDFISHRGRETGCRMFSGGEGDVFASDEMDQ